MKHWRPRSKSSLRREIGKKGPPKDTILIVCEGKKTEVNYFRSFNVTSVSLRVCGAGMSTLRLIDHAIDLRKEQKRYGHIVDQTWCVFDKDDNPDYSFDNAIARAESNNIKVAYSNQAFELWYLLHFEYCDMVVPRDRYKKLLSAYLGRKYKKNSEDMYDLILDKQWRAIQNAENLMKLNNDVSPAMADPSTTVYKLVTELNKYMRI